MKKSLSLLVAIAMVFSMFATVAAAATDTQSKYDELKEAGVFRGTGDGSAALENEMTRAEFAGIIARLTGVSSSDPADFNDVPSTHWATKDINAVVEAGFMQGDGFGNFKPSANVTLQELIIVAVRILGLEVDEDATVEGKAAAWAQPYIAAAEAAGLIQPLGDYTVNATRGDLVDVTYEVYQVLQSIAKVTGYEIVSSTQVVVTFSDGGEVEVELEEPLKLGKNTITVTYNDREYQVEVEFEAVAASAKAVGAKKIEVSFNQAIDDSKAKFAVKNGVVDRVVDKAAFSDDKKKVVLELTTKLQAGETTVTVSGIDSQDIVAKFTAEDERVTQVKFKSDKLALGYDADDKVPIYTEASVGYQILNQYGEEVSNVGATPTFQVSKALDGTPDASNGVLKLKALEHVPFYIGETVIVSGYLLLNTYTVTFNETLTVGQPATVDSVEIIGLYHPENKELTTASTFEDYVLLIEVKDQYGNTLDAEAFNGGVFVSVSNPGIFGVDVAADDQGPDKDKVGIPLKSPEFANFDGKNQIRIVTLFSNKTITYDVDVKKASTVSKISLSAPSQIIAGNDGTVKIPFVAEDQFGNQIKKYSDLVDKVKLYPEYDEDKETGLSLKQDLKTKEAYIELAVPENSGQFAVPYPIMASVTGTGNTSQISLSIYPDAYPESLAGLTSDVASTLAVGAKTTIKADYIKVRDNYGRDKKLADLFGEGYIVEIAANDGDDDVVELSGNVINNKDAKVDLTAKAKGSERIKLTLKNGGETIYTYTNFVISVVDSNAFESYEVDDLPKIHNAVTHAVEVKVYGKRSNGTKVLLPSDKYSVTGSNGLSWDKDSNKVDASGVANDDFDGNGELKAKIVVTIFANSEQIEKEVTVTKQTPVATTIELKDTDDLKISDGVVTGATDDISIRNVFDALKIKDQYGIEMDNDDLAGKFTASVTTYDDADKTNVFKINNNGGPVEGASAASIEGVDKGDSFTVVFTSKDTGVSIQVKVVATE